MLGDVGRPDLAVAGGMKNILMNPSISGKYIKNIIYKKRFF